MQRIDLERFNKLLVEVYECYGNRAPSAAAMVHWADALNSYPFNSVETVLRNWLHTKSKAPVIADITKPCADMLSDRVESHAAAEKAAFAKPIVFMGVTPYGSQCIAKMRAMLRNPNPPSKEWARKIMENQNATEAQREFARPVYETMEKSPEREPGQDDEERVAA